MSYEKWKLAEVSVSTDARVSNPFWDIDVQAEFIHEDHQTRQNVHAFYDGTDDAGRHQWKVRWTPVREGKWTCEISSFPLNDQLSGKIEIEVDPARPESRGFLRADPKASYGFRFDNGEPFFLFGDTMYNLFGAHYCGVDVESILKHRKEQGVNYIRSRLHVSPYHPEVSNQWQNKDCWPWGGSAQLPDFTRFNLAYFRAVDEMVELASKLGIGFEMIFEGWLFEFPFNDRGRFAAEHELFWNQYIVARYAAFDSVYIWCPANEYEFYPSGTPGKYHKESNRWLMRLAKQIRSEDPYAHPIGAHNWEKRIPLPERLDRCDEIEVYLVQTEWGDETKGGKIDASLCKWVEKDLRHHSGNPNKVVVCAEFGYERTEGLLTASWHQRMDHHHTRRGQWRAGFGGHTVVHGFDNTWGAHMRLDKDPIGASYLPHYYRFMTEFVKFDTLRPSPERLLEASGSEEEGTLPLCLTDGNRVTAVYFPASGSCKLSAESASGPSASVRWYNPRTGEFSESQRQQGTEFMTPQTNEGSPGGDDWVLLIEGA